jgi:multicomponent K+:H+ antiporter subunit A
MNNFEPSLLLPLGWILGGVIAALAAGWLSKRQHLRTVTMGWSLAFFPLAAFGTLMWLLGSEFAEIGLIWRYNWLPTFGISISLYFDALSALFALLVSGIGTLVVVYSGYYFKGKNDSWRFQVYLFLFMFFMLGLVLAGDLLTLFIFWEGTSITSFLLIGYKSLDPAAKRGALKSLLITGGGGVALLLGSLLIQQVTGSFEFTAILSSREALLSSGYYPLILGLIALGAFTKSAQVPLHFWLPNAMSAPTPASAYLHSATMVKAGIYLMARLNPSLGFTETWFWLLSITGFVTLLLGAYLGLKQNDLKALLAYSTISQLGALMALIAQDTSIAFKALVIGVLAHALYKSALFLVIGIIDHETGTRDLRELRGLRKVMPGLFVVGLVGALSMAGLPPLFGFLAKETLLATATHPSVPPVMNVFFPIFTVVAGALMLAQSFMLIWDSFFGSESSAVQKAHRPPTWMVVIPALPALLSLALGLLPEPKWLAEFLAQAAQAAYNAPVKVSLALWTGISVPLLLSVVVVISGLVIFLLRHPIRLFQTKFLPAFSMDRVYESVLNGLLSSGHWATRLQTGRLRFYLATMLFGVGILLVRYGELPFQILLEPFSPPIINARLGIEGLRLYVLLITIGAALASVLLRRDVFAILALGVSGFAVATWLLLDPDPDVALVLVVVDILSIVTLVLALVRLPRNQRQQVPQLKIRIKRFGLWRDLLISSAAGFVVMLITLFAISSRPRDSLVTPYYQFNSQSLTGASDIVSAVLVDFRGLDTMIEIMVFAVAGLGVYSLLRYAIPVMAGSYSKKNEDKNHSHRVNDQFIPSSSSPLIRALASVTLSLAFMIGATHLMFGHKQPGDGFTAGIIVSLAIGLWYIVFGYQQTRDRLTWLNPRNLIAGGILLVLSSGLASWLVNGAFLSNLDFSKYLLLPMPEGFKLSTSFLFEIGIFMVVLGSTSFIIDSLGHPGERDQRVNDPRINPEFEDKQWNS